MARPTITPDQQARANRISEILESIRPNAPKEELQAISQQLAEVAGKDDFQLMRMLPHFVQAAARNVDAARVYEHFKLPGRDKIVHDKRDEAAKKSDKEVADDKKIKDVEKKDFAGELEIRRGKLAKPAEKVYENYLGDRTGRGTAAEHGEVEGKIQRLLSAFEEMIVARFEGGRDVAKESADGKPKFLAKTEAQWKEFFDKFIDRLVAKKVSLEEIHEFLFRGVVPKGNKGVVISDMILSDGRVEKYIRFSVLADALVKLKALTPGDSFGREGLLGMMGEEFLYLALAVSRGQDLATSPLPTAGKFLSGIAEEKASQELGLPIGSQDQAQKSAQLRARGRKKSFTGLFGEHEGEPEDLPYQFIPWWHWGNLKRPIMRRRWITIVFYTSLLAVSLIGIAVLTYRFLRP